MAQFTHIFKVPLDTLNQFFVFLLASRSYDQSMSKCSDIILGFLSSTCVIDDIYGDDRSRKKLFKKVLKIFVTKAKDDHKMKLICHIYKILDLQMRMNVILSEDQLDNVINDIRNLDVGSQIEATGKVKLCSLSFIEKPVERRIKFYLKLFLCFLFSCKSQHHPKFNSNKNSSSCEFYAEITQLLASHPRHHKMIYGELMKLFTMKGIYSYLKRKTVMDFFYYKTIRENSSDFFFQVLASFAQEITGSGMIKSSIYINKKETIVKRSLYLGLIILKSLLCEMGSDKQELKNFLSNISCRMTNDITADFYGTDIDHNSILTQVIKNLCYDLLISKYSLLEFFSDDQKTKFIVDLFPAYLSVVLHPKECELSMFDAYLLLALNFHIFKRHSYNLPLNSFDSRVMPVDLALSEHWLAKGLTSSYSKYFIIQNYLMNIADIQNKISIDCFVHEVKRSDDLSILSILAVLLALQNGEMIICKDFHTDFKQLIDILNCEFLTKIHIDVNFSIFYFSLLMNSCEQVDISNNQFIWNQKYTFDTSIHDPSFYLGFIFNDFMLTFFKVNYSFNSPYAKVCGVYQTIDMLLSSSVFIMQRIDEGNYKHVINYLQFTFNAFHFFLAVSEKTILIEENVRYISPYCIFCAKKLSKSKVIRISRYMILCSKCLRENACLSYNPKSSEILNNNLDSNGNGEVSKNIFDCALSLIGVIVAEWGQKSTKMIHVNLKVILLIFKFLNGNLQLTVNNNCTSLEKYIEVFKNLIINPQDFSEGSNVLDINRILNLVRKIKHMGNNILVNKWHGSESEICDTFT